MPRKSYQIIVYLLYKELIQKKQYKSFLLLFICLELVQCFDERGEVTQVTLGEHSSKINQYFVIDP